MKKIKIGDYLVSEKYFETADIAKRSIMAGQVLVGNKRVFSFFEKYTYEQLDALIVHKKEARFVSRAGFKLQKAIDIWNLDFKNKNVLDVGSSTGGFTDCALQAQAKHVTALDVGTNQLAYSLRTHPQVTVVEQTNFRTIADDFFAEKFDLITMDVSFISVNLLLQNVYNNLHDDGIFICLIKPQFELAKDVARERGIITNTDAYEPLLMSFIDSFEQHHLKFNDISLSPIRGTKGNVEFLAKISKKGNNLSNEQIKQVISEIEV